MSSATTKPAEGLSNLLTIDEEYAAPRVVAENAKLRDFRSEYERSVADPEKFWGEYAKNFVWTKPWTKVMEFDGAHHKWFLGAKTNITLNALDRHLTPERRNRAAYIWLGEDGTERVVTYNQLYRMVCRFANGLKSVGVKKGDRVIIYMPLTVEGVVSMLACARIGAIHSVVYAGLGHTALRERIEDAGAKVIITGDVGYRRGKTVPLKSIVDEALEGVEIVNKVIVFNRANTELRGPREVDFNELLKFPADCPAEEMDSEDPLFMLYTSGSTGKPKGVVHVHGGYMVGTTYHLHTYYDVQAEDIFWCTSDIGWIVGHSYIVYSNLCGGVTTLFREGAIDYPQPGVAWEIVERYGVTKMFTAPTALRAIKKEDPRGEHVREHDLSAFRYLFLAGERLDPDTYHWAA
ncbi:MAG TPA: AMP-binding protein, partial [Gemmatimonadales bacterium]